jgi:hypothetical protein
MDNNNFTPLPPMAPMPLTRQSAAYAYPNSVNNQPCNRRMILMTNTGPVLLTSSNIDEALAVQRQKFRRLLQALVLALILLILVTVIPRYIE